MAVASATTLVPTRPANANPPPELWPKGQLVEYISSDQLRIEPSRYERLFISRDRSVDFDRGLAAPVSSSRTLCLPAARLARLQRLMRRASHLPRVIHVRPYLVRGRQRLQFGPRGGHELDALPPLRQFAPSLHYRRLRSRVLRKMIQLLERIKHEAERAPRLEPSHVLRCSRSR